MKIIKIVFIIMLIASIVSMSSYALPMEITQNYSAVNNRLKEVLSDELIGQLKKVSEDTVISVTIQLKDNIDLEAIETAAVEKADLSLTEHEIFETSQENKVATEDKDDRLETLRVRDKIRKQRLLLLENYFVEKNTDFLTDNQIDMKDVGNISLYTPFISDVRLPARRIIELASDLRVKQIGCTLTAQSYDLTSDYPRFTTAETARELIGGDVALNQGYTGSGIRVAVIEDDYPILQTAGGRMAGYSI